MQFVCGDFTSVDLPGEFDLVVSADALMRMRDPAASVQRVAELLKAGGTFLLMTQNRDVCMRRSTRKPLVEGQIQHWFTRQQYQDIMRPFFNIERVETFYPGGDSELLWWVENRYARYAMGRRRWQTFLESIGLGMELVFVARRLPSQYDDKLSIKGDVLR